MIYDLVDEDIARQWANLISQRNVSELCKINQYTGYANIALINDRIQRLYELADEINAYDVTRVIKQEITQDNWRQAFHLMHIHFPEMKNDVRYQDAWPILSEYNDIIHWLESVLLNVWGQQLDSTSGMFRVALDFNKTVFEFYDIPDSAYRLFTPFSSFGDLSLHYTHVGKHALEMLTVGDYDCPSEQFVPQRTFNASCRLYLTDNLYSTNELKENRIQEWNKFYNDRGGLDYWKLDINDPKIALGYCKIGRINSIVRNKEEISIPITPTELHNFRQLIAEGSIIDWEIK
jgi:hypothetical protein